MQPIQEVYTTCKDWCLQQHFYFRNNEILQFVMIPAIALLFFGVEEFFITMADKQGEEKKIMQYQQYARICHVLAITMIMLFYVGFFYLLSKGVFEL